MKGMNLLTRIFQDHNNRSHEVECANPLLHHSKVSSAEDKASHVIKNNNEIKIPK